MTVVAVIPARKGSKGVPGKNRRTVAGRPLWFWSFLATRRGAIDRRVLTTDDPMIARDVACMDFGEVVWRPPELATDTASLDDAIIHAIDAVGLEDDDIVVTLQPTVPVRRPGLVDDCVRTFQAFPAAKSLLTMNKLHFVWAGDAGMHINPPRVNRQAMVSGQVLYEEDGSVFVCRAGDLRESRKRVMDPVILMETERTVDIDTEEDMALAEFLLSRRRENGDETRTESAVSGRREIHGG